MRSSMNAIVSALFILIAWTSFGQYGTKKYMRRNSNAPIYSYADSGIYCRGLYVDSSLIYFGNSNGAIYRYNYDTKSSMLLMKLPNFTEVRDIEATEKLIFGMQSGNTGKLVKISSKGPTGFIEPPEWNGVFLDAMDFRGDLGFIMGDPMDGKFTLFYTENGGTTWQRCAGDVPAAEGEAGFAASGTNVHIMDDSTFVFISGGMQSNFYKSTNRGATWTKTQLPYYPAETIGAYSMCFSDSLNGVVVGGNYKQPELRMNMTFYTSDGGKTWYNASNPTFGYRSCVYYANGIFYACGQNGIDFSANNGKDWTRFATGKFFSMNSINNQLIATMPDGKFRTFNLIQPK